MYLYQGLGHVWKQGEKKVKEDQDKEGKDENQITPACEPEPDPANPLYRELSVKLTGLALIGYRVRIDKFHHSQSSRPFCLCSMGPINVNMSYACSMGQLDSFIS